MLSFAALSLTFRLQEPEKDSHRGNVNLVGMGEKTELEIADMLNMLMFGGLAGYLPYKFPNITCLTCLLVFLQFLVFSPKPTKWL